MENQNRISIIDTLRGWALLIVVISNYIGFAYSQKGTIHGEGIFSTIIETLEIHLFSAKGWTLLFVLFGFGFGILSQKNNTKANFDFIKRMLVLLLFALINSLLYDGDILRDYAVLGILLVFFNKLSARKLFLICITMFLFLPFLESFANTIDTTFIETETSKIAQLRYSYNLYDVVKYNFLNSYYYEILGPSYTYTGHYTMFICMLFGLALQKINFFYDLRLYHKTLIVTSIITLLFTLFFIILNYSDLSKAPFLQYFQPGYWVVLSTMIFTVSCICLLYLNEKCKQLFSYFSVIGKMTLTHYITQNSIAFFVFQGIGFRLFNTMPLYFYFIFAIILYVFQVFFSIWWLKRYQYGPLEYLWRRLSNTLN
jgi:uncharacterized protein